MCVPGSHLYGRPDSVAKLAKNVIGGADYQRKSAGYVQKIIVKSDGQVSRRFRRYADSSQIPLRFK